MRTEEGRRVYGPGPGMLNSTVSASALALASLMAWAREPGPAELVVITVKVAAHVKAGARERTHSARMGIIQPR